ncbi:hypothetical protein COTS27_00013 [Spirochaetota bacterium]|nr:hypothetical protein COTS27_00013 [Spirochaetota bacterium]
MMHKGWILLLVLGVFVGCSVFQREEEITTVNLKPGTPAYYDFIAQNYYQRRKYKQAIYYYNFILEEFSDQPEQYGVELAWATYEIGFCYYKMKQYELAYVQFELVIANYKDWAAVTLARQRLRFLETKFPKLFSTQS